MNHITKSLVVGLSVMILSGCQKTAATSSSAVSVGKTTEWRVNPELVAVTLPDDAQKAWDDSGVSSETGNPQPIALLGRQVVSGMNYAVLCNADVQKNHITQRQMEVITISQDLNEKASIMSTVSLHAETFVNQNHSYKRDSESTGAFETDPSEYKPQDDPKIKDGTLDRIVDTEKNQNHAVAILWNGLDDDGRRSDMAV